MAAGALPPYLSSATPNPAANRAAWYKNTAQSYAGIFLWIAFYDQLAGSAGGPGALGMTGLGTCLLALVVAGLVCHLLFYYVPGLLGMKTGLPLYIVGTSTFGTKGGYFLPGIFMGLLQIGWYSVATYYAAGLVLKGVGAGEYATSLYGEGQAFSLVFVITAIFWGYLFALFGALGIGYVAKMSTFFPIVPIVMLLISGAMAVGYLGQYDRGESSRNALAAATLLKAEEEQAKEAAIAEGKSQAEANKAAADARKEFAKQKATAAAIEDVSLDEAGSQMVAGMTLAGSLLMIQLVIGFFATAGAVGADFCSNNRDANDVCWGGVVGIWAAVIFAAGLALVSVAGAQGMLSEQLTKGEATWGQLVDFTYAGSLGVVSPGLGKVMLILFAIGSIAPACFCSFIIGNSLSTMLGSDKTRIPLTLGGATIGIVLAALGVAGNLAPFFGLIGASFGPVIGAMTADYLKSGRKWAGPRDGISFPGYTAWLLGFIVGILNHPWIGVLDGWHPTSFYSLVVGFLVYWVLANAGMEPQTVEMPQLQTADAAPAEQPAPAEETQPAEGASESAE